MTVTLAKGDSGMLRNGFTAVKTTLMSFRSKRVLVDGDVR